MSEIIGYFKSGFPIIELTINNTKISFLLDTGFNGHILLPKDIIEKLGLIQIGFSEYKTADGKEIPVLSTEGNFSLAGMEMFHNCKIIIERYKNKVELSQ